MKIFYVILAAASALVGGCSRFHGNSATVERQSAPAVSTNYTLRVRNNSLSLLADLLGNEQHVSKLLIIKRDRKELHDLIKRISVGSREDLKLIQQIAQEDREIHLRTTNLPAGEKAARDAEAKATQRELLHAKGADFEFKLLMTQAQAMNYASHLAAVAASDEPDSSRRRVLLKISRQLRGFNDEVLALLRAPNTPASSTISPARH